MTARVTVSEPLRGLRGHLLLPQEARQAFPAWRSTDGLGVDALAIVRYFSPWGRWTWLFTEFDGEDAFFGYCVSGLGQEYDEWGYSSFDELANVRLEKMGGVPAVERDCCYRFGSMTVDELLRDRNPDAKVLVQ